MSAFSKSTFSASSYARYRPQYPPSLYAYLLSHLPSPSSALPSSSLHQSTSNTRSNKAARTLLDIGCGPGLSTFPLITSHRFTKVIAMDPSSKMIDTARSLWSSRSLFTQGEQEEVEFRVGSAEDLSFLKEESIDLAIAGQAAHWFNTTNVYKELERVLKPGGWLIFFVRPPLPSFALPLTMIAQGYGEISIPSSDKGTEIIMKFSKEVVGEYWQQPGRSIVENLLIDLPLPSGRSWEEGKREFSNEKGREGLGLRHEWDLERIEGYLRTWSSLHSYLEKEGRDPVPEVVEELKRAGVEKVRVEWPVGVLKSQKRL